MSYLDKHRSALRRKLEFWAMKKIFRWGDVAFFVAVAAFFVRHAHWNLRTSVGIAIAAIGLALWMTARLQLGSSFSFGAKARALVTIGLYSRFRHPIYLFGFAAYAGVFLMWGRWIPFLCFILLYVIEFARVKREERVLEETFGEEYRRYKARTWF